MLFARCMRHNLSSIEPLKQTGTCAVCGPDSRLKKKGYGWRCYTSEARWQTPGWQRMPDTRQRVGYRVHLKDSCERCGFVPEDACQLDIDHVNGDHGDDRPENLQTLCANCHRLKTKRERAGRDEAPALAG